MKVSDIKVANIVDYLKLDDDTYDETFIQSLIDMSISYIKSYTDIKDYTVTGEEIGIGDGTRTIFNTKYKPIVKDSIVVYIDGAETTEYSCDQLNGVITFSTAPSPDSVITMDYKSGIDAIVEFVYVVFILCQSMYDDRNLYQNSQLSTMNKTVESILGMHCRNLLG